MDTQPEVLVGIDGGGTTTRVLAVTGAGCFLAYAEGEGCSIETDSLDGSAERLRAALQAAGLRGEDVACAVAGIAGINGPGDRPKAEYVVARAGLPGDCLCVNDSIVAHAAAFLGAPGIVAIAGTGSIVHGMTEQGGQVRNYDFGQWAGGAGQLARSVVLRIAAFEARPDDGPLVAEVLRALGVASVPALREALREARLRHLPAVAPLVTVAASAGSPLARTACDEVAEELARGIRLLGPCFQEQPVRVALVGSVATSPYIADAVCRQLQWPPGAYRVVPAACPPVVGAALLALRRRGVVVPEEGARRLSEQVAAFRAARGRA